MIYENFKGEPTWLYMTPLSEHRYYFTVWGAWANLTIRPYIYIYNIKTQLWKYRASKVFYITPVHEKLAPFLPKIVYSITLIYENLPPFLSKIVYSITLIYEKLPPFLSKIVYSITSIYETVPPPPRYCAVLLQSMKTQNWTYPRSCSLSVNYNR